MTAAPAPGAPGAKGIPDLRLGARGKGVMVNAYGDDDEAAKAADPNVIDLKQGHDGHEVCRGASQ